MHPAIFIAGAPRSGTSLLYKLLCLHPGAVWISNWQRRAPGVPALAALNRIARGAETTRRRVWFGAGGQAYAYNQRRSLGRRLFPQPVEGEPVFTRFQIPEVSTATTPSAQQAKLRQNVDRIGRFAGGQTFISKRIAHNRRLSLLHGIFPDAKVIALTRDGRAVASSLQAVDWWADAPIWWSGDTPRTWAAQGRDPWELCARHWVREVEEIERGLAAFPAGSVLQIRYEDLLAEPDRILPQLAKFSGLDPDPRWERALRHIPLRPAGERWRERLGPALQVVEDIQRGKLQHYGYPVGVHHD